MQAMGNPKIGEIGQGTQFQPGKSGNPAGKPKGTKHINSWVQELMQDEDFEATIRDGYNIVEFKGAPIKAIIKAQMIKALNGDTKAYDSLVKSGWVQKQEVSGNDGNPIETSSTVTFIPKQLPNDYWKQDASNDI